MPLQREYRYLLLRLYGHYLKQIKKVLRKPRIHLIIIVSNQLAPLASEMKSKEAE